MSIPILKARNLNDGSGFRFQLLDHLTGQTLFDGEWFPEEAVEGKALEYARDAVQSSIALAKAEFVDGERPSRTRYPQDRSFLATRGR